MATDFLREFLTKENMKQISKEEILQELRKANLKLSKKGEKISVNTSQLIR